MTGYIARQLLLRAKKRKISEKHKRSEKRKRSKYNSNPEYNPDDRLSKLPEEIAVKIVGSLPLKEAAATSILSKQWRYLWTSSTTDLDFDGHPFFKPLFNVDLIPPLVGGASVVKRQRQKYMDWVNSVINQLKSNSSSSIHIHRFRIDFVMTDSFSSSIDNWVKFALTKSVQILDLNLLEVEDLRVTQNYHLHEKLFCDNAAAALRVLRLRGINISGMVVEHLLSKCPYLEELRVDHSLTLTHLRILGGPLKHLELSNCDKIISVEIHDALNLVSFHCVYLQNFFDDHPTLRLVIRNVPKLVDVYLYSSISASFDRVFTTLSYACLSQLQILELDLSDQRNYVENPVYPMLTNLKHLKLHLNTHRNFLLLQIIPFLKVSPYLHTLELKILYYWGSRTALGELVDRPHHHHHHLKEVKIIGYTGESEPNEDELILFLIKNAVSMEKLIIDACIFRSWPPSRYPKMILKDARDHALQHIKDKIPSTVEFICL